MNPITHSQIKELSKLRTSQGRKTQQAFLVEGLVMLEEARKSHWKIEQILTTKEKYQQESERFGLLASPIQIVTQLQLNKLSGHQTPPGCIGVVAIPRTNIDSNLESIILVCDTINDPGNLGTIIRTADWFGIKNLWLSENTVDPFNEKVVRSAMGSLFRATVRQSTDIAKQLQSFKEKGYTIVSSGLAGSSGALPKENMVIIMGNEAHGVRPEILQMSDMIYTIPGDGQAESLNVAISFGIIAYLLTS